MKKDRRTESRRKTRKSEERESDIKKEWGEKCGR
jgi:hypothetical protein